MRCPVAAIANPVFVELIDQLRCPHSHEDCWLVASSELTEGRDIVEGVLGCPVCRAEYPIVGGIARFSGHTLPAGAPTPDETEAMRLAALLDLADRPPGYVVLIGHLGAHARILQRFTEVHLLLVNPPAEVSVGQGVSGLTTDRLLPLAAGGAYAIAFDDRTPADMALSAVDTVRPGGRIVGPSSMLPPPGVTELARDDRTWVAERTAAQSTRPLSIQPHRARRP